MLRRVMLLAALVCAGIGSVGAQTEADTLTSSFSVDGIPVILRRNTSNNVVVANVYLLGGVRQVTPATSGIEPFLLAVSERGTQHYPKAVLRSRTSALGSDFVIAPSVDWTMFGARTITSAVDSTWAIFADRLMYPAIQPAEVELVRAQLLSAQRQERDDPDAYVSDLADSVAFSGHPYAIAETGNATSLAGITAADLRQYQKSQIVKSRMLIVVVGDVTRAHVESLIHSTFGRLPAGSYKWTLPPVVPVTPSSAVLVQRDLPTNYLLGYVAGPLASSPDYTALRVAATVLTGQMFAEIRGRQNLTYDVHAPFLERAASASGLYVTTVAPDTTLKLMKFFITQLQNEIVTREGLQRLELQFITQYFLDNETNASQADFLARSQLYQGDYRRAMSFVEDLKSVTPEAVQAAARKYMKNFHWAYLGDTTKVDRRLLESF
ncbi:MAG TPA: pitrilysin family protein [Gemmatimonadaceae bacterium]|nr:pitrilysin family protein [Gemmatimonadaceae bacterium]